MITKVIKGVLIIICMIIIFSFSNDTKEESSRKSNRVIVNISETVLHRKLTSKEERQYVDKFVFWVRKSAHFILYFILGLLIISFLKEFGLDKKSIIISMIMVLLYACSDEIHQMFIPGRSGEVRDVLIDTSAGLISILLYYLIVKRRIKYE